MRATSATWLCAPVLLCAGATGSAATAAVSTTDTRFANYAFASELGSGLYESSGHTIFVYRLQPAYGLRAAAPRGGRPGIKLIMPITVGFFNFQPSDLLELHVPRQIGALSFEPGVELDYWLSDAWHLYPYFKAGATFASASQTNAFIYGAGLRSDYRFAAWERPWLWRAELIHAGVHYHGELPNDTFTRLRNGLELRRTFAWPHGTHRAQLAPYAFADFYFDAPSGPASGISARTAQFEAGLMFGADPMWQIHGVPLPRLGIGYRAAGVLSGWRLVLGDPF